MPSIVNRIGEIVRSLAERLLLFLCRAECRSNAVDVHAPCIFLRRVGLSQKARRIRFVQKECWNAIWEFTAAPALNVATKSKNTTSSEDGRHMAWTRSYLNLSTV